jgi:hypothetical protein
MTAAQKNAARSRDRTEDFIGGSCLYEFASDLIYQRRSIGSKLAATQLPGAQRS